MIESFFFRLGLFPENGGAFRLRQVPSVFLTEIIVYALRSANAFFYLGFGKVLSGLIKALRWSLSSRQRRCQSTSLGTAPMKCVKAGSTAQFVDGPR